MADALKTYVIKITAEAKQAQQEIDKLAKSFSEIGIKGKFDLDLDKLTEQLTGSIGRVTDAINELKKEFKEGISTRNISDEIKTMSTLMTQAVEQMTTSFTGFSRTFEGLAGEGGLGLSQVFSDFSKEMKEMMSSYKETMEMINKIVNTTLPKDGASIDVGDLIGNIGKNIKGQIKVTEKEIEDAKKQLKEIFNDITDDLDDMQSAAAGKLAKNAEGILAPYGSLQVRGYETSLGRFITAINKVKLKFGSAFDLSEFLSNPDEIGISEYLLKKIRANLIELIDILEEAEKIALREKKLNGKKSQFLLDKEEQDIGIDQERDLLIKVQVDVDLDKLNDEQVNAIVDTITRNVEEKILKKIKPIKIPITFENAIADENDKTIEKDIETAQGEKGLIKSLKLKVETNKQELYDTINDTIKDMGNNIPKIPVKIVVEDMDERSIQNAVNDVSNAIDKRNAEYGRDGYVIGTGGSININSGDLAKDLTLQEIKGILSGIVTDGIALSNGKPGQGGKPNTTTLPPSYDTGDILDQEYGRMLRFRGRKGQLTSYEKDVLSYTESTVADYEFERKRLGQLGELKKIINNTKKGIDDVKKLDFYNQSYTDENGIERAFYGNGEQIDVWRKKIENYYRIYADKMKEVLDAPSVLDEEGNIISEGIRTRFNRIKDKANDKTVEYEGKQIKEWQKVIIDDNERRRQNELNEQGKRDSIKNTSKELIKLLKQSGMTTELAIDRIINEKWNEANELIIKKGSMDKELKKRYGQIQSREIGAARNEILRDRNLLPEDKSSLPYNYTLDSVEKQVGRRINSMKNSLKLSGVDTDKKTGDIIASTIAALNQDQGPKAITSAINKIIEEQKPKLAAFEDVARERKKELDSLTNFISLYEKQQRGEQLSDTEDILMKSLIQDLSTDAARYSAQGSEKARLDAAKKIIEQYEIDEQKAIKENKLMNAGRTDEYMKAMIEYNKVHEASIEEIYGYATTHKDVVAGKYGRDLLAISKLKSKTKQAAEQIASGKEYLGHAVVRKNETPEEYEKRYNEREERLKQVDSRINELETLVEHRDVKINGKMLRKSSWEALTTPELQELKSLRRERNRLWQTLTLSREIMGKGHKWSEEEANKPNEKSIKKGGTIANLHVSDKVAEEYSKIPFKTDIQEIAQMTSELLTAAAAILDEGATEIEQYLSDVKSKDIDEQARLLIAKDVDKLKTLDVELNKEYQKALKEGKTPDDKGVRDIVKLRESILLSLIELASTDDDNEKVADAIAKLKVKEKILDDQIKEATSSHEVSQKDIESLTALKKLASKEQENIRKKGLVVTDENGKQKTYKSSSSGLEQEVQERIRDYAQQRMSEIQNIFDEAGIDTISDVTSSYVSNKNKIASNNAEIEKLSKKNDAESKGRIALLKRQNEITETFIKDFIEPAQEYVSLQEMFEDANTKLLTMSMDEQEGKRTPATTTGKARFKKYKKNIELDIQESEKNASDMRDRAKFLREQAAVRKQEEDVKKQRDEKAEQKRKEDEAFSKLSMERKKESIESDYSVLMEALKQRKEAALTQLNTLSATETDVQKNALKEIDKDLAEITKLLREISHTLEDELTTTTPLTLEGLYESDQLLSELMAKRADKSRINAIATKKIADASERYAATQKDYEKSMQDVLEEIGATNKRIEKIETDKSLNESEKRIAIAYEKQRIETLNARKNVIEGFFENMGEEGAALGRAKIDYSEDVKTTGEELKSLNQEINQRQLEIIKPILEDYEGRIIETRDLFINAVENNSPEEMIVQLRNLLLEMYDQYVAYGGTYKFSNADVDSKVGYIGNKTAIQYARDFEPSSVKERRGEIERLRAQIQANSSIVGKEKTSANESITALGEEISSIEREMELAAIDKTNRLIQLLLSEAETAGQRSARKYANEAFDLKKGMQGGDKALDAAKAKMKELQSKRDEIQKSDKVDYGELGAVEQEIDRQKNIISIFDKIEKDRQKFLEKLKNRGQEPKKVEKVEMDFSDKTEEQIFNEIENLKQERDLLVTSISGAKDSVKAILDSKKNKEATYGSLKSDLRTKSKQDTELEKAIIDNVISELDKNNIRGANKIIKQGGISDERLDIVNKMVELKKLLLDEDKKIEQFSEIEKSASAELDEKLLDIKVRQDALKQRQIGQTKLRDAEVLKQHKENGDVEDERFEEERKDYDPWKSWRYAGMSEEEAVISERIRSLMYKAFTGAIEDAEKIELDTLKQKASEMGLELTDKGVKPKVEYADYMANPDKYLVPKITTEMAEKYGVSTRGTISGAVQAVSVTDPVNVGTVSNVASVNLATIEALLSSIASKIGADTSGIPIGSTATNTLPKFDYSGKTKSELNSILSSKNSTLDLIDSAALAALKMGKSLQLLDTGRYSIRNKSNGDIKTPEDYFKSKNITIKADNATVKSGKQEEKQTGTQEKKKQKNYSNPMAALAHQANEEYRAAKDEAEQLEIQKKYVSQGLKLGKYTSKKGKYAGQERVFLTAGHGANEADTNDFITKHGIKVEVKVDAESKSEPKPNQTGEKSKSQAKEPSQLSEGQVKPTREGASRLRTAIQNATSLEAIDAVVKEAFEGGYGVNKKNDGTYTVKKNIDKESIKDYETYLAQRQKLDDEYFAKKEKKENNLALKDLASEGNRKYHEAKTEADKKQVLKDYVSKGLNLFEQEVPATDKNGKPKANAGQKRLVLAATKTIGGVDITDSFIKDNNITVKVEVESKEEPDGKTQPKSEEPKKAAPKKTIAEQRGKANETPVSTQSEEASEHNENAKSMEQETLAAFDLKTAIEYLNDAYASGGKDAALSYLDALNKDQMRQIAEEQGFTNQRGNLPKTGSLTREGWKGLLVGNIAGEIKKPLVATDNTPSDIVDDIKNEEEVVTEATEATITLAEKINQLKEAASKKQDATELLKSIMDEHGKKGLEEALDELSNTQLKNVIEANGYADGKTIKGNKDQLRKRILDKFRDETVPVGATTGEINPTDDLHELLVSIQQETEARKENADAKKEEAEAGKSDDNEAQETQEETNRVNEQAEAYDRLAEAKKKAQEMADAYNDPEKLLKDIDKKLKILDTRVTNPDTKERYELELEAMRKRLEVLKADTGIKTDDEGIKENTEDLKGNKDAAEDAADAQQEFHEKAEEPINSEGVKEDTEELKRAEEAARAAAEAHEKYQKTVESLKLKDADDNYVKLEIKNAEDALNMIRALLNDEKKQFGNAIDFRMKAGSNTFSLSDEIGNNYVYRYSKKEGHQLYETPELANQLTQLRLFENEVQRVMNMTSVKDVGGFMSSMFSEKDAEKVERAQEIMEKLSHMKEDIYAEDGFLKVDDDTLLNYKDELQELRDLVKQLHRQDVGEIVNVGQTTGGLATAKADLLAYFNTLDQGNASLVKFSNSNTEMVYTLRTADNMLETHTVSIDKYGQMMDKLSSSTKYLSPLQQLFSGVANKARELFNYFAASTSIYEVINILRRGVGIIKDFDDALTEMRKVSDESISSLKSFLAESFGIANSVGTTALQVQQSTADWMRLGETLDEAKESAKNATILLNVSEFSSIDDATLSLVSMSQAYKELDKIEIIDKLNNIGNNFSISTDLLATGLLNASAVLKTQGNDLDQAIALLTAGNAITQDVSKTSAGIRTIALRISGTEEAKNEIQDMGEDVDDFVVRTRSKTDQIIKDYTAVASNAYKGVSVLDANGNLRDTYDILLDIAKIYKEIQKEDKARGTNRAQALVETLAGKNRSNIAASILENPELLEEVYQSSLQSAGSALQENEKYLDSISGKLQLITNQMQEFATITINSDGIKAVLDIVNSLLSGVNSLAKEFGVVNTAIGAFVAFFMLKKGLGIFNFDKNTQQIGSGIPKIIDGIKKSFGKLEIEPEIAADFLKMDLSGNFFDQLLENDTKSDKLFEFADGLNEVQKKSMTAGQAMMHFGTSVTSVGSVLDTIGQVALSTVSSILTTVAVSAALGLAAKGIGWFWTNVVKAEETAIQKGNEAKQSIDEINKEYQDAEKQTKELGKRYNELRSGVLYKEGKGYTNNTLSADEFEEFLNVNQQIAALYPELRSGTDAQGRAYVDLGSDADTATSALQKYLDIQRELANEKIGEKFGDQLEGVLANNNRINRDILNDNYTIKSSSSNLLVAQEGLESLIQDIGNGNYQLTIKGGTDKNGELQDAIEQGFKDIGIDKQYGGNYYDENGLLVTDIMYYFKADTSELENAIAETEKIVGKERDKYDEAAKASSNKALSERAIRDNWESLKPSLLASISSTKTYKDLSETYLNIVSEAVANMDLLKAYEKMPDNFEGGFELFIKNQYLYTMSNIVLGDDGEIKEANAKLLDELFNFDSSNMTNREYKDYINNIMNDLTKDLEKPEEAKKQIKLILGFKIEDEDGESWDIDNRRNNLWEKLGGKIVEENGKTKHKRGESVIKWSDFKNLTLSDYDALDYAVSNMNIDFEKELSKNAKQALDTFLKQYAKQKKYYDNQLITGNETDKEEAENWLTWYNNQIDKISKLGNPLETVLDIIERAKKELESTNKETKDGKLFDIFGDENYQANVENYEKNLSSLTSALETLRTEGRLTAEQMRDLQEQFPDLTDFSVSGISKKASLELSKWVGEFKSGWTDFSEEGLKQMDTYIANMVASYREFDISQADAMKAVRESTVTSKTPGSLEWVDLQQLVADGIAALKSEYGEDLNWSIVLALQDQFSGDTDALIAKYADYELIWKIEVDKEETLRQIDSVLQQRETNNARLSLNEALGISKTAKDYDADNALSDMLIDYYEHLREIAINNIKNAHTDEGGVLDEIGQSMIDATNAEFDLKILGEKTNQANNRKAMQDLILKQYDQALSDIDREMELRDQQRLTKERNGLTDFTQENLEDITAIGTQNRIIDEEKILIQNQMKALEGLAKAYGDNVEEYDRYKELKEQLQSKEDEQFENDKQRAEKLKEISDTRLNELQQRSELLGLESLAAQDRITKKKANGSITEADYQFAIGEIENEKQGKIDELRFYQRRRANILAKYGWDEEKASKDSGWSLVEQDIASTQSTVDSLDESIRNLSKDMNNIPMDKLSIERNDLNRELELLDRKMNDSRRGEPQAIDYISSMVINQGIKTNLQKSIAEKMKEKDTYNYKEGTEAYETWKQELQGLEDELYNATLRQEEFVESLIKFPAEQITKGIQKYETELQHLQDQQDLKVSLGFSLTTEDYDKMIKQNENILSKRLGLETVLNIGKNIFSGIGFDTTWFDELISSNESSIISIMKNIAGLGRDLAELPLKDLQDQLDKVQLAGEKAKNVFDEILRSGRDATKADYEILQENLEAQKGLTEQISLANLELYSAAKGDEDQTKYWTLYMQAENALASLTQQQYEYEEAIKQLPITELINQVGGFTDLQREASEIQQEITEAETKHTKVSDKLYQKLIDNGDDQIDNLKLQRKEWENLQNKVALGSSKWHEYQNEINSIDDSISEMRQNQVGWFEQMTSAVSTNAAALSSAISSAFSEMNSETGISIDTMNELQKQFSDLAGRDVSNIFYETADGMKMNVVAAENLIDAEYKLQTNELYNAIEKQRDIIEKQGDATDENARKTVSAAEQKINAYQRELSMLQALYDQQKQQFTQYAAWQTAQLTDNAGKHYEDIQGYYQTAKEMYEKGLIGTDDFQEYVKYFDQWGQGTVEAYERNKSKIERYVTEDSTGIFNLFDDLVAKGFGTYSDENGYDFNITDVKKAADALGISEEFFRDVFSRGEDYGATNDWVESELDGRMKIQEAAQKQIDAQMRYNEALRNGASLEVLDEILGEIDLYGNSITNLGENIADVTEHTGQISASLLRAGVDDINSLIKLRNDTEDEQVKDLIDLNIKALAEEKGIILTPDVHPNVDEEAMRLEFEGYEFEIPVNPDWSRLDGFEDETLSSAVAKIKENWEENKESAKSYIETLQGVDPEVLASIDLHDGRYAEGLETYEKALDSLAETFGLDTQEAQKLVDILNQLGMLGGEELWYTYNKSLGVLTGSLKESLDTAFQNGDITEEINLDFDATKMSLVEIGDKMRELKSFKFKGLLSPEAEAQLDNMLLALSNMGQFKSLFPNGEINTGETTYTAEEFLAKDKSEQESIMMKIGLDTSQYDQFVSYVLSQTIQAKITATMEETGTTADELSGLSDSEFAIKLGIDESLVEQYRQELENMTAEVPISVKIDKELFDALLNPEVNTETAISLIQDVQTEIDNVKQKNPVVIEVKHGTAIANIQQVERKLNSIPDGHANVILDGTADVSSKLDILIDKIKKLTEKTHIIRVQEVQVGGTVNGTSYGGKNMATGTAFSTGTAAFANGTGHDWTVGKDTDALVNEIGVESMVRDGVWRIIPGGPHVEKLKKNDIIDECDFIQ